MSRVSLRVNGRVRDAEVTPRTHLADLLRETHNLTGTHIGCEHGVCGACTLLLDGMPARACITFAAACEGAEVTTIEGLDDDEIARELRAAFTARHALQCGYCTPGMIVSARDVVLRMAAPDEHAIRVAMSGNLCRCTGYVGIVRAIQAVIADRRARGIAAIPGGGRDRLGPAGAGHAGAASAPPPAASVPAAAPLAALPDAAGVPPGWTPQVTFRQSFVSAHPAEAVWTFLGRIEEVAACLPGATLDRIGPDGRVDGRIRAKIGPVAAEFGGTAHIARDGQTRTGTIAGTGRDVRSNSMTRGRITYAVAPDPSGAGTRVDVDIGYTLTGMLAQFGRPGLVQDLAARLAAAFAQNLEGRLSHAQGVDGAPPPAPARPLDAGALIVAVLVGRLKRALRRLLGRS